MRRWACAVVTGTEPSAEPYDDLSTSHHPARRLSCGIPQRPPKTIFGSTPGVDQRAGRRPRHVTSRWSDRPQPDRRLCQFADPLGHGILTARGVDLLFEGRVEATTRTRRGDRLHLPSNGELAQFRIAGCARWPPDILRQTRSSTTTPRPTSGDPSGRRHRTELSASTRHGRPGLRAAAGERLNRQQMR